jgi:CRISPR/Cas system CMR subunit Cmr4 (Cas7 group RAMP superfamily)
MELDARMIGTGGVRTMVARWVLTGEVVLGTACHLGGESDGPTDMVLLRDARTGAPLLPGTSLAGALRSHLADVLGGYGSQEPAAIVALFGGAGGDDDGAQSPLVVFDSVGALPEGGAVEVRDGVAIDARTGTAEDRKKYDFEALPPGTVFPLRFELVVTDRKQEPERLSCLATALAGFEAAGGISLGARRSRGLGTVTARSWRAQRFDLTSAREWIEWLTSDPRAPIDRAEPSRSTAREAFVLALARSAPSVKLAVYPDARVRAVFRVALKVAGSLLVRSPARTADAPDVVHLSSGGRSVLPGTSSAGVLRAHAKRIARCVHEGWTDTDAEEKIATIFGPRLEGTRDPSFKPWASRLRVSEREVTGKTVRVTRIRVDRFTQGVMDGALFDEEPAREGSLELFLELRDPRPAELGLLILVLKDLISGRLPVGGGGAVGRGVLKGRATLEVPTWPRPIVLEPGRPLAPEDLGRIDETIRAFHEAPRARGAEVAR